MALISTTVKPSQIAAKNVGRTLQGAIVMIIVSLMILGGLGSRLLYLQMVEGEHNRELADENRIRLIPSPPERGRVYDRKGRLLVGSRISYSVFLWPFMQEEEEWPRTLQNLAKILEIPEAEIQARLEKEGYKSPYRVRVARGIKIQDVIAIEEAQNQLLGAEVDAESVRYYPNGDLAAHVLGYTGEITEAELEELEDADYRLGDVIGKSGIEAALEADLRGIWGGQQVEVDAGGQVIQILGEKPSIAGNNQTLTLDLDLQKAAEKALGNTKGAILAMDPRDGAILAMASRPTYDPNLFSRRITDQEWERLQGLEHPFLNRAMRSFAPASTFKIVTTAAALESGLYRPGDVLPTYPFVAVGGIQFWDWNRAGFGPLGFTGAMAWSSDTFFYQVAQTIGGETLIEWTRNFGFGDHTGIELVDEEDPGLVPDEAWKREQIGEGWFVGDSINMSIGQGYMQATPLQVAVMFAVPANGGDLVRPHLRKDWYNPEELRRPMNLQPSTLDILQRGLREVVIGGTGGAMNEASLPANAGKTGTAEDQPRKSHAWYGGYAPLDDPEILVVAFGQNTGGGGSGVALPKVKQVLEAYFKLEQAE